MTAEEILKMICPRDTASPDGRTAQVRELLRSLVCGGSETGVRAVRIEDAFDRYRETIAATGAVPSRKTVSAKRNSLRKFIDWRNAHRPECVYVSQVTRSVAGAFASRFNTLPGCSDKTKREGLSDLGRMWNVLMSIDETIRENPWRFFRRAVKDQRRGTPFTPEEVSKILASAIGTEWHTASMIALWTGLRFGDVCRLKWEDVDWESGLLRVKPSKTASHGISVTIPIADDLWYALGAIRMPGGPIMPGLYRAYPHSKRHPDGSFSSILGKAGITGHRFHDFRHTFASRLADSGASNDAIKKLGGWTVDATAQRYQHSERLGELRDAIWRMSETSGYANMAAKSLP